MNRDKFVKAEQFHTISSGSDFGENITGKIESSTPQKSSTIPNTDYYFILYNKMLMPFQTKENRKFEIILLFLLFLSTGQSS